MVGLATLHKTEKLLIRIGRVTGLDQLHRSKLMNDGKKLDAVYTSSTFLTHVQAIRMHARMLYACMHTCTCTRTHTHHCF